jgi:carbon monoxide dehydrogenase subunit G
VGEDEYAMNMRVDVAAFAGLFTGKIKVSEANPPQSFRILVEGGVLFGFLKGEGLMSLTPSAAGTELHYDGDVLVGGAIAALGQRTIDTSAKIMIRKFFEKFVEAVEAQQ